MKHLFIFNSFVNYIGPASTIILNIIFTPLLINFYGLDNWTIIGLIFLLQPICYLVLFGTNNFINREIINIFNLNKSSEILSLFNQIEKKLYLKSIIFFLILLIFLLILSEIQYIEYAKFSLIVLVLIITLKIFEIFFSATLNGLKDHLILNLLLTFSSILKWALGYFIILFWNLSINYFLLIFLLMTFITLLMLKIRVKFFFYGISREVKYIYTNKKFLNDIAKTAIFILLIFQFDKFIIIFSESKKQLGSFSLAFMVASSLPQLITPMLSYFAPILNELNELNESLKHSKLNLKLILYNIFFSTTCGITILFFGERLLTFWLGDPDLSKNVHKYLIPLSLIYLNYNLLIQMQNYFTSTKNLSRFKIILIYISILLLILLIICKIYLTFLFFLYCSMLVLTSLSIFFYTSLIYKK